MVGCFKKGCLRLCCVVPELLNGDPTTNYQLPPNHSTLWFDIILTHNR